MVNLECDNENFEGNDETPETKMFKMTTVGCWNFFTKISRGVNGIDRAK